MNFLLGIFLFTMTSPAVSQIPAVPASEMATNGQSTDAEGGAPWTLSTVPTIHNKLNSSGDPES